MSVRIMKLVSLLMAVLLLAGCAQTAVTEEVVYIDPVPLADAAFDKEVKPLSESSAATITLEDPIEYLHRNKRSIVSQREIAIDTADYLAALRACLRQAPDVILLGEMRDPETIRTAMTAAETGHTLIATLHTKGAVNTIDRIVDSFPSAQQVQIRVQLAEVLRTVVSQQLLPDVHGGLVPAYEIMHMTSAIRSLIRDNKGHQIDNAIAAGAREGMITMDQSILGLYRSGCITLETALEYADNPEQLRRAIG